MGKLSTELCSKLQNEDFKYVYNTLQDVKISSQTEILNLIVISCEVFRAAVPRNSICSEDLLKLLESLTKQLTVLNGKQFEKYLQAMFCFLKDLSRKNCYSAIIQFKTFIFPSFFQAQLSVRLTQFYYNIMTSIYNNFGKIFNTRLKEHSNDMLPLAEIIIEIAEKTQTSALHAEYVNRCVLALLGMDIPPKQIEKFYLNNIKSFENTKDKEVTLKLLTCLTHFYRYRNFSEAETCLQTTYDTFTTNCPEITSILSIRTWFNTTNTDTVIELKNVLLALRKYLKTNGWTDTSQALFKLIRYIALNNETVILNKSPTQQLAFFKFFWYMSNDFKTVQCKCPCKNSKCTVENEIFDACEFISVICRIGTKYLSKSKETDRIYKEELLKYLDSYSETCNELKSLNCQHFSKVYTECTYFFYQIGLFLHKNSDPESSIIFMKRYARAVLFHEDVPQADQHQYLAGAFKTIAENFCQLQQYEKALATSALACFLLKLDASSPQAVIWIKTKLACRENTSLQRSTFVSVLETCKEEITDSYFSKEFKLTSNDKIRLLSLELQAYKKRWKSKVPMMSAFKQLVSLADTLTCAKIAVRTWEFGNIPAQESFSNVLRDLAKKLPETSPSSSLLLAHLHFLVHKLQLVDAIVENCNHIEKTILNMTKVQAEQEQELVPGDAADDIEIVSAYSSLKLNKYVQMMKPLDASFALLQVTLQKSFEGDENVELETLYNLLIQIGHEYFLHNHKIKSVAMLKLALEYAVKLDKKEWILQSTGYVLEQTSCGNSAKISEMLKRAEENIPYLEENGFFRELFVYFLCKTEVFLLSSPETAFASFALAAKYKEKFTNEAIHSARMDYVHHRLLMLPCKFNADEHAKRTNSLIHFAQAHAFRHYNQIQSEITVDSSYNMSVFFQIQEEMTKMYADLHLPRQTVAYTKEVLVIAQKMILPFRVTKLLYYLSQADIFFGNLHGCEEKLSGLTTILGILPRGTPSPKPVKKKKDLEEEALDSLASSMREMVLEMPKNSAYVEVRPSSPSFRVETFRLPSFLSHKYTCQCFTCNWLEYQLAILHKALLQGILHVYGKNLNLAQEFFCGGIRIFNGLKQRNEKILVAQHLSDLVSTRLFNETQYLLLKEMGDVLLRCGGKGIDCAEETNTMLLDMFKKTEQLDLMHVYNKIVLQKFNIFKLKSGAKPQKQSKNRLSVETLASGTSTASTTPESKQSKVTVSVVSSPRSLSPVPHPTKRYVKPIKFNIFDEEEETKEAQPKKQSNKNLVPNFVASSAKTPVTKIKVYTAKAATTRKKKVLSDIATPQVKEEEDLADFLMPASPNEHTSCPTVEKKPEKKLIDRSKILTEKLKSSMKKPAVNENLASSSRKKSARINLLSDLEQAESDNVTQKLRRSRRNI